MRIQILTTPNSETLPFSHQQKLVGTIHKWLGHNEIHDKISLYSFSWLHGARKDGNGLWLPNGGRMFISFYEDKYVMQLIETIRQDPYMFCGISVTDIIIENNPDLSERKRFNFGSPIFIKRKLDNGDEKHFTFNDNEANRLMEETLRSKMRQAGLPDDESLKIEFDLSYARKNTKLVKYHNIGNVANECPVIINGEPETKLFAWNVGIGNCTGIGFGAIY